MRKVIAREAGEAVYLVSMTAMADDSPDCDSLLAAGGGRK